MTVKGRLPVPQHIDNYGPRHGLVRPCRGPYPFQREGPQATVSGLGRVVPVGVAGVGPASRDTSLGPVSSGRVVGPGLARHACGRTVVSGVVSPPNTVIFCEKLAGSDRGNAGSFENGARVQAPRTRGAAVSQLRLQDRQDFP